MSWLRRMFGRPDPSLERKFEQAHVKHDVVIAKTNHVLREADRLEALRSGALRAEKRMIRR